MYFDLDLNLVTFQYIDGFGCHHFCFTRFGLGLMIFSQTSSQLLGLQVTVLIRASQRINQDFLFCLFKMLSLVSDQRNKFAPLSIMSSNLQNWLDIHSSNPFS